MKLITILCFIIGIYGCGERVVIQEVDVPVSVSCITEIPVEPEYVTAKWVYGQDIWKQTGLLLAEREQRKADQEVLRAAIGGCVRK